MADSNKRTECIKVCFTEKEFVHIGRLCAREDRKPADMVYVLVRRAMYGIIAPPQQDDEGTDSD